MRRTNDSVVRFEHVWPFKMMGYSGCLRAVARIAAECFCHVRYGRMCACPSLLHAAEIRRLGAAMRILRGNVLATGRVPRSKTGVVLADDMSLFLQNVSTFPFKEPFYAYACPARPILYTKMPPKKLPPYVPVYDPRLLDTRRDVREPILPPPASVSPWVGHLVQANRVEHARHLRDKVHTLERLEADRDMHQPDADLFRESSRELLRRNGYPELAEGIVMMSDLPQGPSAEAQRERDHFFTVTQHILSDLQERSLAHRDAAVAAYNRAYKKVDKADPMEHVRHMGLDLALADKESRGDTGSGLFLPRGRALDRLYVD